MHNRGLGRQCCRFVKGKIMNRKIISVYLWINENQPQLIIVFEDGEEYTQDIDYDSYQGLSWAGVEIKS